MDDLKKKLDELVKNSDLFVSSPETIKRLQDQGLPIKSVFTTYKEYLDKLFIEKQEKAEHSIGKLPLLNDKIANATIQSLYEEFKECFILGIPGAAITLSIILLEVALKYRLYKERLLSDPNSKWDSIEQIDSLGTVSNLYKVKLLNNDERVELTNFNINYRNKYIHYNIQNLVKDMVLEELKSVDIETGDVQILKNVKPAEHPYLWFSAKKAMDKQILLSVSSFCIQWVNKISTR